MKPSVRQLNYFPEFSETLKLVGVMAVGASFKSVTSTVRVSSSMLPALSVTSTTANASLDDLTGYVPELAEAAEKIAAEAVYLGIPN